MQYLGEMGIKDNFDVIITADDVTSHKPEPGPLLEALRRLGAKREDAIMIVIRDLTLAALSMPE